MKKGHRELRGILKLALVVTVLMIGLTPLVSATVTEFHITPHILGSCEEETQFFLTARFDPAVHWHNTSIPAGLCFEPPTESGIPIVSTQFFDKDGNLLGKVIIWSKNTDPSAPTVDVEAWIGTDYILIPNKPISYEPGIPFEIVTPGGNTLQMRLQSETEPGYLKVTTPNMLIGEFRDEWMVKICCCLEEHRPNVFTTTAEGDPVGKNDTIPYCGAPVPVYTPPGMAILVVIMGLVIGIATVRRKR